MQISQGSFPELDWGAQVGLAGLAQARDDLTTAMQAYRQAASALSRVRYNFWQPALAGSYLLTQSAFFNRAVSLAARAGAWQEALQFIEANKATTLLRQLLTASEASLDSRSQELNDLKAEIDLLQGQLRASLNRTAGFQSAIRSRQARSELAEKVKRYDALLARIERQQLPGQTSRLQGANFDLALFRQAVGRVLGSAWIALDYYLLDDSLITIEIGPHHCELHQAAVSNRALQALGECLKARQGGTLPLQGDLEVLGDTLIPTATVKRLDPDTVLLLAPHKKLHGIPWAALQPGSLAAPLVTRCIPQVAPSLLNLVTLLERDSHPPAGNLRSGLVIGVSQFRGKHRDLPQVHAEINWLASALDGGGQVLFQQDATWERITGLGRTGAGSQGEAKGLARFDWMHVASHIFADPLSGRLSGIALWDGDVWLDQLRDLAPLPELVTFSACNSIYSFVYEGDEHVGVATTCLVSGARCVVGSIWPVLDRDSAEFMLGFYRGYLDGLSSARAAAQAQRQMNSRGLDTGAWAGFVCMGVP